MTSGKPKPSRTLNGKQAARLLARVTMALVVSSSSLFAQDRIPLGAYGTILRSTLDVAPMTTQAAAASPGRWSSRHPVLLGSLIGAGGAMLWQGASCRGPSCKVGVAGLVGAGAGAYTGLVVSAIQKAKQKQPVGRKTKIGIATGAIGAAVGVFLACYGAGGCGGVS